LESLVKAFGISQSMSDRCHVLPLFAAWRILVKEPKSSQSMPPIHRCRILRNLLTERITDIGPAGAVANSQEPTLAGQPNGKIFLQTLKDD